MDEVECNNCGWQGSVSELICSDEDFESGKSTQEINFNLCPDCATDDVVDSDEE